MSSSETSGPEDPRLEKGSRPPRKGSWRPVDRSIWARRKIPEGLPSIVSITLQRLAGIFSSAPFFVFVVAPVGGLGAYLSFLVAYELGGARLFGVYLIGIWAAVIVGIVAVLEKTGYSRNFEGWDFPLRRIIVLPIGFTVAAGLLLLIFYLTGALR